jgi:hypothetical protein
MNGRGIDGGSDVHELEAESSAGESELADVADERDVGIVDGDVEIGLIVQAGGLVATDASRVFFLRGVDFAAACAGKQERRAAGEDRSGGHCPNPSGNLLPAWNSHTFHLDCKFAFLVRTERTEFLACGGLISGVRIWSWAEALPGQAAIAGGKTFLVLNVPDEGVKLVGGLNSAEIVFERGRD